MMDLSAAYEESKALLEQHGQAHLLAFWGELGEAERGELLADIAEIDFERCAPLIDQYVTQEPEIELPSSIEPPEILPAPPDATDQQSRYAAAWKQGAAAIADGKVAAFVVAGGQGTRLGFDGPKGAFPISPIRNIPLFQWFAEFLRGAERRYGRRPPWYVMTSPVNHAATLNVFETHDYFGLPRGDVFFFKQGQMPAFAPDGRMILAEKHRVALAPDGHGGSLTALAKSGALADMRQRGVEHLSYFQVDNPLVRPVDPLFVGLHLETGSEMSSKALTKAYDKEKVGNFCLVDGKLTVIEYSDLPDELAEARTPEGQRKFDAGSIAIHVLSCDFVERLTESGGRLRLPWHRANKKVPYVDANGNVQTPESPNAIKLEMFVFDALPLARNPLVIYTRREEEFSPVKNAEGVDSPATTRRDMVRRGARWLAACGAEVPRTADNEPEAMIEIAPAFAVDAEDLRSQLREVPTIQRGQALLLE